MKPEPRISIAMATYNGGAFLEAQLESFVAQSRKPDELVVTDDGSTDNTEAIVRSFSERAPFAVRWESNAQRMGPAGNFERALSLCTGDIVFLSDHDDVWFPEKIATLVSELTPGPEAPGPEVACVICDALLSDGDLKTQGRTKRGAMRDAKVADIHFVMGCCAAFTRELLDLALPFPQGEKSHDNWIVGLADALGTVRRTDHVLQYYRLHGNNFSDFFVNRPHPETWMERMERALKSSRRRLGSDSLAEELKRTSQWHARIGERRDAVVALLGTAKAEATLAKLAEKERMLNARMTVRQTPRRRRLGLIAHGLRSGLYAGNGIGVAKDFIARSPGKAGSNDGS